MNQYDILLKLLTGSIIITKEFGKPILDKEKINSDFVHLLHHIEFIVHYDANNETGENYFSLNDLFIINNKISIPKIDQKIETFKKINKWYLNGNKQFEEFEIAYEKVRIKGIRKEKIKRINLNNENIP